jgi:hypothetical protein
VGDLLHPIRVFWAGRRGSCKADGLHWSLDVCPAIPGIPNMTEIDLVPGQVAQVRIGCDAIRDLTTDERVQALKWLASEARKQRGGA